MDLPVGVVIASDFSVCSWWHNRRSHWANAFRPVHGPLLVETGGVNDLLAPQKAADKALAGIHPNETHRPDTKGPAKAKRRNPPLTNNPETPPVSPPSTPIPPPAPILPLDSPRDQTAVQANPLRRSPRGSPTKPYPCSGDEDVSDKTKSKKSNDSESLSEEFEGPIKAPRRQHISPKQLIPNPHSFFCFFKYMELSTHSPLLLSMAL